MLEFPECRIMARQMNEHLRGKRIEAVLPPKKAHKFCWFAGDPANYEQRLRNACITGAESFGFYVELSFDNGEKLVINDGVNARLLSGADVPQNYQLMICLNDQTVLAFTVAMYGAIILHKGDYDNSYYQRSKSAVSPLSDGFPAVFQDALSHAKPALSAKAFLATEQRFPGIGNGVTQDILFAAKINPRQKLANLSAQQKDSLKNSVVAVLAQMLEQGGRDTEKDLFGAPGGYQTKLSKLAVRCPACSQEIVKEQYLGGSVYYCPSCQPKP